MTNVVRNLFGMYASTKRLFIFLLRVNGGLGIKRISDVYYTKRVDFLIKMLNHDEENFPLIARESLKLDMIKMGVDVTRNARSFLDYELNDEVVNIA